MSESTNGNTGWQENESGDVVPPSGDAPIAPGQLYANQADLTVEHPVTVRPAERDEDGHLPGPSAAFQALREGEQRAADREQAKIDARAERFRRTAEWAAQDKLDREKRKSA